MTEVDPEHLNHAGRPLHGYRGVEAGAPWAQPQPHTLAQVELGASTQRKPGKDIKNLMDGCVRKGHYRSIVGVKGGHWQGIGYPRKCQTVNNPAGSQVGSQHLDG